MTLRILVTGVRGQVGTEVMRHGAALGYQMHGVDRAELDIRDADGVQRVMAHCAPDAVINAAAYTAVDRAEVERDAAFAVNRDGPANLARACEAAGIPLLHFSTDYVFDGRKDGGWSEDDAPNPLGVYGASKLAGEMAVQSSCRRHLILRTSWVFSAHGHNFVKSMLRLGAERDELGVVDDQLGKPTAAAEIARLALAALPAADGWWGLYHLAQPEAVSWYGFAEAVFSEARQAGMPLRLERLRAITTTEYPTPAVRPANSVLECARFVQAFGIAPRSWRIDLHETISALAGRDRLHPLG